MGNRDPSFDTLLDLHGQVLVIDEVGYWVKFVVNQVPETTVKPHGLDYSLTLHGPDGERLVGFDSAHPVDGQRRTEQDHRHRLRTLRLPRCRRTGGRFLGRGGSADARERSLDMTMTTLKVGIASY